MFVFEFGFTLGTQVDTGLGWLQFPLWVLESKDDEEHEAIMDDLSICKDELHVKMWNLREAWCDDTGDGFSFLTGS